MHLTYCIEWLWCRDRCGYGVLQYKGKLRKAHRVAYALFNNIDISEIDGIIIRHQCDNPGCCNPEHLISGTHQDNEDDKTKRGRRPVGELVGNSKLTSSQIIEIRGLYKKQSKEFGSVSLGRKYGVHSSLIRYIVGGKLWKSVS